jgi:hypothetical protein
LSGLLNLARAYERAVWPAVAELVPEVGLEAMDVPSIYLEAIAWGNRGHHLS